MSTNSSNRSRDTLNNIFIPVYRIKLMTVAIGTRTCRATSLIIQANTTTSRSDTSSGVYSEARTLKNPLYLGYTNHAHLVSIGLPGCSNSTSKLRTICGTTFVISSRLIFLPMQVRDPPPNFVRSPVSLYTCDIIASRVLPYREHH